MSAKTPEFIRHLIALVLSMVLVHTAYITLIRPSAEAQLKAQAELLASGQDFVAERSLAIILKDYEQEACFILMLWAIALIVFKAQHIQAERHSVQRRHLEIGDGEYITPENSAAVAAPLEKLSAEEQQHLLPSALLAALHRFQSTHNIQHAANAIKESCEAEADRLDSDLSLIRYIAWAIPSIGFIGTVRGIGDALSQAHRAVEGDIAGVTASLGVAFNSTFTALVLSIVIMFLIHQLQQAQERLILDTQRYCDRYLLRFLKV